MTPARGLQVGLASAKGSPGVTTLALALGLRWPGPVVVGELDPAGGDLAARLALAPSGGLAALADWARHSVNWQQLVAHMAPATPTCSVLLGPADPLLSGGAVSVLAPELPEVTRSVGVTAVWDLGRLDPASPAWPAVGVCDRVAVVVRPNAAELAHAIPLLDQLVRSGCPAGVVVASPRRRRRAHGDDDVAAALAERVGGPVAMLGRVARDPLGVWMAESLMSRWGASALGTSVREVMGRIAAATGPGGRGGVAGAGVPGAATLAGEPLWPYQPTLTAYGRSWPGATR